MTEARKLPTRAADHGAKAGPVRSEAFTWGELFTGTREQLVQQGIVPPEAPFPGDRPGRARCTFVRTDGRRGSVVRAGRVKFMARVDYPDGRRDLDGKSRQARGELETMRLYSAHLPKSEAEFRASVLEHLRGATGFLAMRYFTDAQLKAGGLRRPPNNSGIIPQTESGFALDDKTVGSVLTLLATAEEMLERAPVVRHEANLAERIARQEATVAARSDDKFQAMLARTVRPREQRP